MSSSLGAKATLEQCRCFRDDLVGGVSMKKERRIFPSTGCISSVEAKIEGRMVRLSTCMSRRPTARHMTMAAKPEMERAGR